MGFAGILAEGNDRFYNTVGFKTSSEYAIFPVSGYPMTEALKTYYDEAGVDYLYLMIHDYVSGEPYILCEGEGAKEVCAAAMGSAFDTYLTLKESVSRKAVFVPALTRAILGEE